MGEAIVSVDADTTAGAEATAQDESIQAMNARLHTLVDHTLGFGMVDGMTKQQLVKPSRAGPPVFAPYASTATTFQSEENATTVDDAMNWEHIAQLAPVGLDVGARTQGRLAWKTVREKSVVVCHYTRVIAQRSIPTPRYKDLLPVKRRKHLDANNRWLVELYGNQLCTTEYYGGQVDIAFMWNRTANISVSEIVSAIETIVDGSKAHRSVVKKAQMSELKCSADVKGFKLPNDTRSNLTTVSGIMTLLSELNTLPIPCAVPVGTKTVPIQAVGGCPREIGVETCIHEDETLRKLTAVQLKLEAHEPAKLAVRDFVVDLKHAIQQAATSNRSLLPMWRALADDVAAKLARHGSRFELYERYGQQRLHTENCDARGVTSASECLNWLTLGVAIIGTRPYQASVFDNAPAWKAPEHYEAHKICDTAAVSGYYDRVKVVLLFNDDTLVAKWRQQLDHLVSEGRRQAEQLIKRSLLSLW